jgi:hypothetical protein
MSANQYQGGYVIVDSGPGIGQTLRIAENSQITSGTSGTITLEDGPNTALTTSSTVCFIPPHGANQVVMPTTATGAIGGLTIYPLSAGTAAAGTTGNYAYVATKGVFSALSDSLVASVGQGVTYSLTVPGATSLSGGTGATVGYANQTAVNQKARSIFIDL